MSAPFRPISRFAPALLLLAASAFSQEFPAVPGVAISSDAVSSPGGPAQPAPGAIGAEPGSEPLFIEPIWPRPDASFPYLKRSFVFGHATPGSSVTLNGAALASDARGAFFGLVDFSTGAFELRFEAVKAGASTSAARLVSVADSELALGATGPVLLEPREDVELAPGDAFLLRLRAPPGLEGEFSIKRVAKGEPLYETAPGLYEGRYLVSSEDRGEDLPVAFSLRSREGGRFKGEAAGRVSVLEAGAYRVGVSTGRVATLKTQAQGYELFLPPGVLLNLSGRKGSQWKARLAEGREYWVDADRVELLAVGTPPASGTLGRYVRGELGPKAARLLLPLDKRLPFEVRQSVEPLAFEIRVFGAAQRVDRVRLDPLDPVIESVSFRQEQTDVLLVDVKTRLAWGWGYEASYDKAGRLVLEIRRPPRMAASGDALAGRKIFLDAGHAPDSGAWGPMGSQEQHINLELTLKLKELLEGAGAEVFLTRSSTAGVPLLDRNFLAAESGAELLLSVHNNAVAVTDNPLEPPRGFMTFYYHPQSLRLAESVHAAYRESSPLPDESLQWGDLYICRLTRMPAVLTETAYVMLPEQEALLLDPAWRERFARMLLEGVRSYFEAYRKLQLGSEDERKAAAAR